MYDIYFKAFLIILITGAKMSIIDINFLKLLTLENLGNSSFL